MGKIVILDELTANKIAAGEVVERPASVIKELIENSIDAGANNISVEIKNGGISYLKVTDNGTGIDEDDIEIAFERHATSKIRSADDLDNIGSFGFRGEALASIASVSKVELITKTKEQTYGTQIKIKGGNVIEIAKAGCTFGTIFTVKELFYNTPARFKFLKKDSTEAGYVSDMLSRVALGNPNIAFKLTSNWSEVIQTSGNGDLKDAIYSIYGKEVASNLTWVSYKDNKLKISGYVGKSEIAKANRNYQSFFINKRYIKSKIITAALEDAYKTLLMKNKYPFAVLNIEINSQLVDVNVHPTKMEVRFSNDQDIFKAVYNAVEGALYSEPTTGLIYNSPYENKTNKELFSLTPKKQIEEDNIQQTIQSDSHVIKSEILIQNIAINEEPLNFVVSSSDSIKEFEKISEEAYRELVIKKLDEEIKVEVVIESNNSNVIDFFELQKNAKIENNYLENSNHKKSLSNEDFLKEAVYKGQMFSTYLMFQQGEKFILLDQHAAHERVIFEEIKSKFNNNENLSQILLASEIIEFTNQELLFAEENKEILNNIGFEFENFGQNSLVLRSVPFGSDISNVKQSFIEIFDYLFNSIKNDINEIYEEMLYSIACKAAIKANYVIDELEVDELVNKMRKLYNPYTCPHGRPLTTQFTKYEIEKMFKRSL